MSGPPILSADEKLDALGQEERRQILLSLHLQETDEEPRWNVREFADAYQLDLTQIFHTSLPKLSRYGLVDWDEETGRFSRGPDFGKIQPLLSLLYEHQDELQAEWFPSE